ncbi:hypothetical protein [Paenibacillus chitinolyticus]|uniref:hypothetical protein n=1 Tax=Paenibacillus chitinolyticus TaxID=79263 RepID=UPI003CFEA7BE
MNQSNELAPILGMVLEKLLELTGSEAWIFLPLREWAGECFCDGPAANRRPISVFENRCRVHRFFSLSGF